MDGGPSVTSVPGSILSGGYDEAEEGCLSTGVHLQLLRQLDPQRLHLSVANDLLQDKLLTWLEANSTITEKLPSEADPSPAAATEAETSPAAAGEEAAAS